MEEWKECKLEEISKNITDGTHSTVIDDISGNYFLLSCKNVKNGIIQISNSERKINKETFEKLRKRTKLEKDDILVTTVGTIGEMAIITDHNPHYEFQRSVGIIKPNKDIVDPKFLYYSLKNELPQIMNRTLGAVQQCLFLGDIKQLSIKLPPLPSQQKIAAILSSLDNKIELNNKINTNLEQQAQALFKNWFVDFEPFGDKMPEEWKVGKLSDIAEITSGKRPPMKQSDFSKDVSIPLVGAASVMGYTNQVLYNEPILITGRVGTHGVIQRFSTECWPSDNTLVVKSQYYEYVYQIMCNIDYDNMNRGSTQPLITQSDLGKVECIIPDEENLNKFEQLASILFSKFHENQQENQKLTNIRDTLLPKLMNGEIDLEIFQI